jgi:hypothetical protein
MKRECDNCGEAHEEFDMVATPKCVWVCAPCFAEDPGCYGFDFDLDDIDEGAGSWDISRHRR